MAKPKPTIAQMTAESATDRVVGGCMPLLWVLLGAGILTAFLLRLIT
jgi:hypothetical protein